MTTRSTVPIISTVSGVISPTTGMRTCWRSITRMRMARQRSSVRLVRRLCSFARPGDPFAAPPFAKLGPQPLKCEVTQQIAYIGLVAKVMRQEAVGVFRVRALVDKGVWFDFEQMPGGHFGAQVQIIRSIRTRKIDQKQAARLEQPPHLIDRS